MNPDDSVLHQLNPPIRARYIRFLPEEWKERISMRVELYGCKGHYFFFHYCCLTNYELLYNQYLRFIKRKISVGLEFQCYCFKDPHRGKRTSVFTAMLDNAKYKCRLDLLLGLSFFQ